MIVSQNSEKQNQKQITRYQPYGQSLTQTSNFLKTEISKIIKEELKTFGLKNKIAEEVQNYQKRLINKQMLKTMFQDRMNNFKLKQQSIRRKKYDDFIKKKKQRQVKLKTFFQDKKQNHHEKFAQITSTLSQIKQKHDHMVTADEHFRINRLRKFTTQKNRTQVRSRNSSSSRVDSLHSQDARSYIHQSHDERQLYLVNSYLKKIERCESRVLTKELENEKRIQTSKGSRVKCLVEQRNRQEVQKMDKVQKQYNSRMDHFASNRNLIFKRKETIQINRSTHNFKKYKRAAEKRAEIADKSLQDSQSSMNHSKENFLKQYKSGIDFSNNKRNMETNLKKMKDEENQNKLEAAIKMLTQKLQKIRNVKYGQKLDDYSIKVILSMMDKKDPQYNSIMEFLKSERMAYLEGVVKKEEERNKFNKSKKQNKIVSKIGTM